MPIPKPGPSEDQKTFIARCMGDPGMVKEYEQEQRAGICFTQWKGRNKTAGPQPTASNLGDISAALSGRLTVNQVLHRKGD